MGSDPIALPVLEYLAGEASARVDIAGVFTQPDRPSGRGRKLNPNEIKKWAVSRGIEVLQPERPGGNEAKWFLNEGCDLTLVMAYGHILRRELLDAAPLGTYNLHTSLLPKYRGASPIQTALACGEIWTGVTLMRMALRMDAGPLIDQEAFPVDRLETGATATEKAAAACVPLIMRNLDGLLSGNLSLREQREEVATYTRKLEKSDGGLDFSAPADVLARRINALHPWPGAFLEHEGQRLKVALADWIEEDPGACPGTVVDLDGAGPTISTRKPLAVSTGRGVLLLAMLQRPGGRLLRAEEFLRGFPLPAGTLLSSRAMPPLVADRPFRCSNSADC